jgi:hypothetical protein
MEFSFSFSFVINFNFARLKQSGEFIAENLTISVNSSDLNSNRLFQRKCFFFNIRNLLEQF